MQNECLNKVREVYASIDAASDLKKHDITLTEYHVIEFMLRDLQNDGETRTILESVKNFFERYGVKVEPERMSWKITNND